ncbi:diguanylate cyclase [bacterium]|nr:diguanylate cyclase [bacterium]
MQKTVLNKSKKSPQRKADFDLQPCLLVLNGFDAGSMIHIDQQSMNMGSTKNNAIALRGQGIDELHARLDIVDKKNITISHYSKVYPTMINGQSIYQTSIKENDCIQIGELQLKFVYKSYDELSLNEFNFKKNMLDSYGVLKKDFFEQRFSKELDYAQKTGQSLSCVMLSVETESAQKDTKHHVELIKKSSRRYDILCRYQDNIFCILLKNTALDNALIFAHRLQNNFKQYGDAPIRINLGISSTQNDCIYDSASMLNNAFGFLQEACKRERVNIVSQRNI